ncbi:tetratricopeptide repeat protein [Flavobacterium sp. HNIBRBA15423]|uniref:tetratricopeptide repeat protein n=1 Tax=Flavobacterium sp. HNIBRBA15423 TaxID=3458683 RepID=UPI004043E8B3
MQEDMYVIFENYLLNQMTIEDKMEFENQLLSDADLNEKFQLYKQLTQFLESKFSKETDDFKNNLKIISKQHVSKEENLDKSKVVPIYSKWFAIAATVVVFISVWFFMQNSTPKYGDYNQHEKAYFTERSEGNANLKLAQDAFNEKEYQKAIVYFEKITNKDLGEEGNLFYAISLIEANQYNKAEAILQNIKEDNSVYKEKSIWYLGLLKLKQKKYDECKEILETLSKEAEEYDKAQEIVKKI